MTHQNPDHTPRNGPDGASLGNPFGMFGPYGSAQPPASKKVQSSKNGWGVKGTPAGPGGPAAPQPQQYPQANAQQGGAVNPSGFANPHAPHASQSAYSPSNRFDVNGTPAGPVGPVSSARPVAPQPQPPQYPQPNVQRGGAVNASGFANPHNWQGQQGPQNPFGPQKRWGVKGAPVGPGGPGAPQSQQYSQPNAQQRAAVNPYSFAQASAPRNPTASPNHHGVPKSWGVKGTPVGPGGPLAPPSKQYSKSNAQKRRTGFGFAFGYLAVIWSVHFLNFLIFGGALSDFGLHPLDITGIWHLPLSPLLHSDFGHLVSNSLPGALFCFFIGYSGARVFWEVTGIVFVLESTGTWFFGGVGTNHIGASGLVYGWLTYLIVRGFFNRSGTQITLGVILGFVYSGLIWGVIPGNEGVSWQGHLFGAIGGFAAGMLITSDDPPKLAARRQERKARRNQGYV